MNRVEAKEIIRRHGLLFASMPDEVLEALDVLMSTNWVSIKDRLPKENGIYYVSGKGKVWLCEFLYLGNLLGGWCNGAENPIVEAWMPMPEPYEEDE